MVAPLQRVIHTIETTSTQPAFSESGFAPALQQLSVALESPVQFLVASLQFTTHSAHG